MLIVRKIIQSAVSSLIKKIIWNYCINTNEYYFEYLLYFRKGR